ncbi:MAG: flagellar basal-body MS-ring/collar protein FliF [Thiomonas sp.]|uniref:flagellar basal-body MS-ring/collar protein FliF n=1 Tax=Thiomonas sp. TaxID=2047785 RepID=UPI002A3685FF|nr:flagellar basal-body MS-ring/collar protein FliF [Thiomonas sp.]MDY0331362.1 flagellar basal-body MS-ring/collar protein FliF [Thiomonas sp.]
MATTPAAALQDPLGAFRQMNMNQRFTWLAGLAALIALIIVTLMWTTRLDYQVLYTNLSERDGGAVIGELQKLNIPYRITGGGAVIEVPSSQVYATRMKLAADGLPRGAGVGFEVLDNEPMGTSQFVERINYQRALEGSLGRTIESLSAVQSATVHLAIPKPSVFLSEAEKPSASVLLKLYPGRVLSGAQVAGIVHLVSSAVAGLPDKNVSVIDQDGNLLTAGTRADSGIQPDQLAYRNTIEQQYRKQIEALLAPLVGNDGVRVAVSADLDFARSESSSVFYGQGHVLSQQQQSTTSTGNAGLPAGVPGALTNQPPGGVTAPFTVGSASAPLTPQQLAQITPSLKTLAPTAASSSATTNYDLDKTVSHTQQPVGRVKRLSVSVLVNDQTRAGKPAPLSAAQLAQMKQLVENAIGFDAKRGDTVSIVNMPFTAAQKEAEKQLPLWRQPWVWDAVRQAVPYAIALILGFLAYRAMRKAASGGKRRRGEQAAEPGAGARTAATEESAQASPGVSAGTERAAAGLPGALAPDTVHLSNTLESDAAVSRELVKQDPRRAAQVVKEWLSDGQ